MVRTLNTSISECTTNLRRSTVEDSWNGADNRERQINIKEAKVEAKWRAKPMKPQGT